MKIDRLVKATLFSAALSLVSIAALAQTTPAKEKRDKLEDKIDRKEDKLDRKENRAECRNKVIEAVVLIRQRGRITDLKVDRG